MTDRIARALVTGASAGIGEGFARRLAGHGVELVLVARRESRLRSLATELPVRAQVLAADLSDPDQVTRVVARVASAVEPIDLLVNDAGFGAYGPLATADADAARSMVEVNVAALTRLTRAALPQLLARDRGGIINVGSTAGYRPCPHAAIYGASKAFVRSFTEAVHDEVGGTGVHVMLVAPGSTSTEFQQVAGLRSDVLPERLRTSVDTVVTAALRAFAARRAVCVPGAASRAAAIGAELTPSMVARRVSSVAVRRMLAS